MKAKNQAISFRKSHGEKTRQKELRYESFSACLQAAYRQASVTCEHTHVMAMLRFPQKHAWARIFISHIHPLNKLKLYFSF